jgi:hypothetical protein
LNHGSCLKPRCRWLNALPGIALLAAASAASTAPVTFPDRKGQIDFITPSGNIGCIYTPAGGVEVYKPTDGGPELSCDRAQPKYIRVELARKGAASLIKDISDQSCCGSDNTLAYGQQWSAGPFSCSSALAGLTCKRDDGHGFFISRRSVKVH